MGRLMNKNDPLEVVGCAKGHSHEEIINNLPRHCKFSPNLFKQIKKIPEVIFRNSGTLIAKKINRMMREVTTEAYRAKQFTRTEINNRGVLFGVVSLRHRVMDLVLNYFHERWPECIICLYNEHSGKTGIINEKGRIQEIDSTLKSVVERVSKNRRVIPYFNDIQFSGKEIFETLYKSQFISERENQNYFKRMIPDSCFELPGMRGGIEKRFRNKKINDFL
ncbi:MAG: DUF4130 domain-containing protein [Candidatus Lokiarchaeota archaeon]|nr:DUF4130 domain-containing protein [Candidatus Lokiarchaeota archaeon]